MLLCFDASKFGISLDEAVALAAQKNVPAIEFSFEPFEVTAKTAKLSEQEIEYLSGVKQSCEEASVRIDTLRLNYVLDAEDKKAVKNFQLMMRKLGALAKAVGCERVIFALKPGANDERMNTAAAAINPVLAEFDKLGLKLLLSTQTPLANREQSLRLWRPMEPQEWRDLIAHCTGLALSFSAADCAWQNINYLQILPGLVSAIEHVEANDVEINRDLLHDSGLFGPLWWRYRKPGKGTIDWRQLIEALKMYEYQGSLSIHFEDEFLDTAGGGLEEALDHSIRFFTPMLKY